MLLVNLFLYIDIYIDNNVKFRIKSEINIIAEIDVIIKIICYF